MDLVLDRIRKLSETCTGSLEFMVYKYVDWSITVPLQRFEFNLIRKAADLVLDRIQKLSETCTGLQEFMVYMYVDRSITVP